MPLQGLQERSLQRQPDAGEVRRMLGLGVHANAVVGAAPNVGGDRQLHDLIEGRHRELTVKPAILRPQVPKPLAPRCAITITLFNRTPTVPGLKFTVGLPPGDALQ